MPRRLTPDLWLFGVVLALVSIGVVMVYSASAIMAADRFHDPVHFLKKQGVWAGLGMIAGLVARGGRSLRIPWLATMAILVTYVGLVWCAGTYTSPGASGNHATPPLFPKFRDEFESPTKVTSAGEYTGRCVATSWRASRCGGTQTQPPPAYPPSTCAHRP